MKTLAWQKKQKTAPHCLAHMVILAMLFSAAMLLLPGCGDQSGSTGKTTVPIQKLATEPATGTLGLIYFNTTENREYIYSGAEWVPHDASIDTYVSKKRVMASAPQDFCFDSSGNNLCPDIMHHQHGAVMNDCLGCHNLSISFWVPDTFFKNPLTAAFIQPSTTSNKPVYLQSSDWDLQPPATYRPASCSNIACHNVPPGTFQYYFPDGTGELALVTVTYGGVSGGALNWNNSNTGGGISSADCGGCHNNPPTNGVYHSGMHATNIPGANSCEFCHPDAQSRGTENTITNPILHMNQAVNVVATYNSKCFYCH